MPLKEPPGNKPLPLWELGNGYPCKSLKRKLFIGSDTIGLEERENLHMGCYQKQQSCQVRYK